MHSGSGEPLIVITAANDVTDQLFSYSVVTVTVFISSVFGLFPRTIRPPVTAVSH